MDTYTSRSAIVDPKKLTVPSNTTKTKPLTSAVTNQQPIALTLLTGQEGARCTKKLTLKDDGTLQKDSAPLFGKGEARTVELRSLNDLPELLDGLGTNQCVATGVFNQPKTSIVTQKNLTGEMVKQGSRSRSKTHMTQPDHGLILIDYDPSPYMPEALCCTSVEEVMEKLAQAIPELASVGYVGTTSSSAGLLNTETGEAYPGGGFHIYIAVENVNLDALKTRFEMALWITGFGYIAFAKNGAMLTRTIIDLAVLSSERLIYEARPLLGEGISQKQRTWTYQDGPALKRGCDMSESDTLKFKQLVAEDRNDPVNAERSRQIKEAYIATKAPEYAAANNTTVKVAIDRIRTQVKEQNHGQDVTLQSDFVLTVIGKPMIVAELIKQGSEFNGCYMPDPIEGPSYGQGTAVYNHNAGNAPCIVSYAHGQTTVYQLCEFERVITEVVEPIPTNPISSEADSTDLVPIQKPKVSPNPLDAYCLNGKSADFAEQLQADTFVLPGIALRGQSTVLFGPPNAGKTLTVIAALICAIETDLVDASDVYYINADDTLRGLTHKLNLAEEFGFNMIAPGHDGFKTEKFGEIVRTLTDSCDLNKPIIVLDTLKKFVDLMDKRASSKFWNMIRPFIAKGCTLIALAHVNKKRDNDNKPIFAGVSDTIDDSDCVYVLDVLQDNDEQRVVEFLNKKARGDVARRLAVSYSSKQGDSYSQRLASIKDVDPEQLDALRAVNEPDGDETATIQAITRCISDGIKTKMKLAAAVAEITGVSKRKVTGLIELYTGDDPTVHQWHFVRKAKGAQVFSLLESPPDPPTTVKAES